MFLIQFPFIMKGYNYITILTVVLLIFSEHYASSQESFAQDINYLRLPASENYDHNMLKAPEIKNVSFAMNTGIMMLANKNKDYSICSQFSAFYNINISRRVSIRTGSIIFLPLYNHIFSSPRENYGLTSYSGIALFAAADYYATERLTITGTVYKTISKRLLSKEDMPQAINRNYYAMPLQSYSLGMSYKISDGLTIGAEIRISDYYQPALSPFNDFHGLYQPASLYW